MHRIIQGDTLKVLKTLQTDSIDCIVTSPPYYGLRDYGVDGQVGLEPTLDEYLDRMLAITAELKRVLKPTGTMWWNHGDNFSRGCATSRFSTITDRKYSADDTRMKGGGTAVPEKSLTFQAHRLAIRMLDEQGWTLRNIVIWHKSNMLPNPVQDRFQIDYEPIFFFVKSRRYYFERQFDPFAECSYKEAIKAAKSMGFDPERETYADWYFNRRPKQRFHNRNPLREGYHKDNAPDLVHPNGRSKRSVWKIPNKPFKGAHFATFPPALIEIPIKAGCPEGGIVLDPFLGSGTTAVVAQKLGRRWIGIELNREYIKLAYERIAAA